MKTIRVIPRLGIKGKVMIGRWGRGLFRSIWIWVVVLGIGRAVPSWGCEPCLRILSLKETAAAADLIVVGRRLDPVTEDPGVPGGPDAISVGVLRVLKGLPVGPVIRVNAWNGMCPYGIVVTDDRPYVMMLVRRKDAGAGILYDTVADGCAVKALPVRDGVVELGEERRRTVVSGGEERFWGRPTFIGRCPRTSGRSGTGSGGCGIA